MLLKITLKCLSLRVVLECDRFTVEFGTPGMLKSMFSSSIARLNSLSALNDAMSRFSSGKNVLSLCVCLSCLAPQVALFHREHA